MNHAALLPLTLLFATSALGVGACVASDGSDGSDRSGSADSLADEAVGEAASALVVENGQNLNGQNLNGQNLNGQNLNGQNLNGPDAGTFTVWTSLEGVKLDGQTLDSTTLDGTKFVGKKGSSTTSGLGFEQAEFQAQRGDGTPVRLRLRDIVAPPDGGDTWRYFVEYRESDGNWFPICSDASGPRAAIPLAGTWDHRQGVEGGGSHTDDPLKFTFACETGGALYKCVAAGYAPWRTHAGVQLAKHHQACVRLLRGDYCGDGTSYTTDGSLVNLYDGLGIQEDTEDDWVIEAEWDERGARCFYPLNRSQAGIPCYDARVEVGCGAEANFSRGALLMNETPSGGLTP